MAKRLAALALLPGLLGGCGWATAAIVAATAGGGGGSSSSPAPAAPAGTPTTVTAITPAIGPASGGQTVTITGTGFQAGATAGFGGGAAIQLTSVVVVNATTLTGVTAAAADSTYDVTVINTNATATPLINGYTYDGTPPAFTGAAAGTALSPYSMEVTWSAASDFNTATANIVYDLYVATASGGQNFGAAPFATSDPGVLRFVVGGLLPSTQYYVVVRARDEFGNADTNTAEVNATTPSAPAVTNGPSSGLLGNPRHSHGAGLLTNGTILVAGGISLTATPTATSEIYDPATGTWSSTTGNIGTARYDFPLVVMDNGQAVIGGGRNGTTYYNTAQVYDPATSTWSTTANLSAARAYATGTKLLDGRVVIAGGGNNTAPLSSVDLYDPTTGTWTTGTSMGTTRQQHAAVLLQDGRILVSGGRNSATTDTPTAEIYDPATGTWTATGSMLANRFDHTLTVLPKGTVLAIGGGSGSSALSSCELWNPTTGTWTTRGALATARTEHTATLLPAGRVLVLAGAAAPGGAKLNSSEVYSIRADGWSAGPTVGSVSHHSATLLPSGQVAMVGGDSGATTSGGTNFIDHRAPTWRTGSSLSGTRVGPVTVMLPNGQALLCGGNQGSSATNTAFLYNPATGTFTGTGNMTAARLSHRVVLMRSGKLLAVAGQNTLPLASAELYDPAIGTWTATGSLAGARSNGCTCTTLRDGRLLVAGGETTGPTWYSACELYDPVTGTWTATGNMSTARFWHSASLLPDGKVLVAGGDTGSGVVATSELYDPATGTWTATTGSMATARANHGVATLPDGRIVVVGGQNPTFQSSCEIYDPATGTWTATGAIAAANQVPWVGLMPDGQVLIAGGNTGGGSTYTNATQVYDPAQGTWLTRSTLVTGRYQAGAALLPTNELLFAGGYNGSGMSSVEIRNPGHGFATFAQPRIDTVAGSAVFPVSVKPSAAITITGARFRGASEAAGGATGSSPSDTPVVTLLGPIGVSSHSTYSTSFGRRIVLPATGFAGGAQLTITIPAAYSMTSNTSGLAEGYYYLHVTTNGIPSEARIVKVEADGALDSGFGTNGVLQVNPSTGGESVLGFTSDGTDVYLVGTDRTPGNAQWRIEKRSLATGALDGTFGSGTGVVTTNPSANDDDIFFVINDGTHMYIAGSDRSQGAANQQWRLEKRSLTTGALDTNFNTTGIVTVNPSSGAEDLYHVVLSGGNLYCFGTDKALGGNNWQWRIEKRNATTGALVTAFGTNGVQLSNPTAGVDVPLQATTDGTNLYIAGYVDSFNNGEWHIEKRSMTTGGLVTAFNSTGSITSAFSGGNEWARAIVLTGGNLYIGGHDAIGGDERWRIECRNPTSGALISGFGTSGVLSIDPGSGNDQLHQLLTDGTAIWALGVDRGTTGSDPQFRAEKRSLSTGALLPTFGAGGVVISNPTTGGDLLERGVLSGNFLFLAGVDQAPGNQQWRIEKRTK